MFIEKSYPRSEMLGQVPIEYFCNQPKAGAVTVPSSSNRGVAAPAAAPSSSQTAAYGLHITKINLLN